MPRTTQPTVAGALPRLEGRVFTPDRECVKLNLGSSPIAVPGWINVDKSPGVSLVRWPRLRSTLVSVRLLAPHQREGFSRGVICGDATRRLPLDSGSVDYIYSSHLIERLSRWQAKRFLVECRRLLRPGGRIRIATPDLALLVQRYFEAPASRPAGDTLMEEMHMFRHLEASWPKRVVSRNLNGHWHQWLYDEQSLEQLLRESGFVTIEVECFREGRFPDLRTIETQPDSLFVEAEY